MAKLGHTRLDFVKLDIEGSEYCVVADIVSKRILPDQLCIEFHHGLFGYTAEDTKMAVALLHGVGYLLHYVSMNGHEYGFHLAKNTDGSIVDQS